jgi:ribosomal protein S18 acetylase RimI-like enzyme
MEIVTLTKAIAQTYTSDFTALLNLIPLRFYSDEAFLADAEDGVELRGKWERSLAMMNDGQAIGLIIAYERALIPNSVYSENSIHISAIAIDQSWQHKGFGRKLLYQFLVKNIQIPFRYLIGRMYFTTQINASDWNHRARELFESYGFTIIGTRTYENYRDLVLAAHENELRL